LRYAQTTHHTTHMASITRYKDKWRAHVFKNGTRTSKLFETKKDAQAWALREEVRIESATGKETRLLSDAFDHYLKTVSIGKVDAVEWERRRFGYMLVFFGDVAIGSIDSARVGQWRDDRLRTVTGSTLRRESTLLRHMFALAVKEWKWIKENPFDGVRMPQESEARTQIWRWQQIKKVLRYGHTAGGKTQEVCEAFHISLRTAMRLQECLAAPAHFDKARRVVRVKTKTARGGEDIPITRQGAKLLDRPAFVVNPNEASVLFSKVTRKLMLGDLHFHDARATALTLLAKKVDVMVLARISRHKDISLLHRVYYRATADEIAAKL